MDQSMNTVPSFTPWNQHLSTMRILYTNRNFAITIPTFAYYRPQWALKCKCKNVQSSNYHNWPSPGCCSHNGYWKNVVSKSCKPKLKRVRNRLPTSEIHHCKAWNRGRQPLHRSQHLPDILEERQVKLIGYLVNFVGYVKVESALKPGVERAGTEMEILQSPI